MSEATELRTIALIGLPGSGKTSVGRALAQRLGRIFLDLDDLVEQRTGRPAANWLDRDGEPRFREIESGVLREALARPGAPAHRAIVLATGGGAIIDPLNRWALSDAGVSAWLDAADEVLLERVLTSSVGRPLLGTPGGGSAALAGLRTAREPFYRAAQIHVDATPPVTAVVDALMGELERGQWARGSARLYDAIVARDHPNGPAHARIVMGRGLDAPLFADVLAHVSGRNPVVIADARAAAALPGFVTALPGSRRISIRAGESAKRMRSLERILEQAAAFGLERGDGWIAFGGGTTGDLVATAAALYQRGAPLVHVPTTWVGQADSAIGGKAAVDLARSKNAAGAFWPPVAVLSDVTALRTLPRPRLLDGLAESLKSGLIGDRELWRLIEERGLAAVDPRQPDEPARYALVERSARVKLAVVARDPYERGERRQLNLGHTIGHALEIESGYRLRHGQAVILGLRAVAAIGQRRGAEQGLSDRIDALVSDLGYAMKRAFDPDAVRRAIGADKKRVDGRQRWILPMAVGQVQEVDDVTEGELELALRTISAAAPERGSASRRAAPRGSASRRAAHLAAA